MAKKLILETHKIVVCVSPLRKCLFLYITDVLVRTARVLMHARFLATSYAQIQKTPSAYEQAMGNERRSPHCACINISEALLGSWQELHTDEIQK